MSNVPRVRSSCAFMYGYRACILCWFGSTIICFQSLWSHGHRKNSEVSIQFLSLFIKTLFVKILVLHIEFDAAGFYVNNNDNNVDINLIRLYCTHNWILILNILYKPNFSSTSLLNNFPLGTGRMLIFHTELMAFKQSVHFVQRLWMVHLDMLSSYFRIIWIRIWIWV